MQILDDKRQKNVTNFFLFALASKMLYKKILKLQQK